MAIGTSRKSALAGTGCLTLFALPFAAVGVGMTWWCAYIALRHTAMQSWVEVPAVIKSAELKEAHGDGTTYQAVAVYDYEFGGKKFTGKRVGIDSGSDNIGNFQRDAYEELKRHLNQRKPFHCYVDPNKPGEAVLYRSLRGEMLGFYTLFATTFGSAGLALMTGAIAGARRTPKISTAVVTDDQPWRVRDDWAVGTIRSSGGAVAAPIVVVVAVYWNIASLPLISKLPEILRQPNAGWNWVFLAYPIIGAVLIGLLIRQILQSRKFGESVLQLASTPGVIGGQLAGVVQIPKRVDAAEGFRLKLSCLDWVSNNDSREEKVIWQDERIVMKPMCDDVAGTMAVPVLFAIPFDCAETPRAGEKREIHWRLDVSASVSGIDYKSRFDVPVFKTSESRPDFKLDERLVASYTSPPGNDLVLRQAAIVKEPLGDGVRIVFPMARNPAGAFIVTIFLAVWSCATWAMWFHAPVFMTIIFGLFDIIPLLLALELWFYRSVIEASAGELSIRGGWLGIGRPRTVAAADIKEFSTKESMSSGANVWNNIIVRTNDGKKRTIAKRVPGKLAQQAIIDELSAALHLPSNADGRK